MQMKNQKKWQTSALKETQLSSFFLGILVLFAFGFVLHQLKSIFIPLMVSVLLSFVFDPMVNFLQHLKVPKFLALLITLIFVFIFFYLLGVIIYASIAAFTEEFPKYQFKFIAVYQKILGALEIPKEDVTNYLKQVNWSDLWKNFSVSSFITSIAGSFISFLTNLLLVLIFTIYIMLGKQHFINKIEKAFPGPQSGKIATIAKNINKGVQKYLVAKTMISLVTGIIVTMILLIFRIDFAIVWGLFTFLLNFIPTIGSIVATMPPILVAFFQYGSIFPAIWVTLLLIGTQMTMGNIIEPRVMGKSLNLSPLGVMLSLIFWALIWGPVGMVLAVPISSAAQIISANIDKLRPLSVMLGGEEILSEESNGSIVSDINDSVEKVPLRRF